MNVKNGSEHNFFGSLVNGIYPTHNESDLFKSLVNNRSGLTSKGSSFWNSITGSPISHRTRSKMFKKRSLLGEISSNCYPNFSSFERHQLVISGSKELSSNLSALPAMPEVDEKKKDKPFMFSTPGPEFGKKPQSDIIEGEHLTPIVFVHENTMNSQNMIASGTGCDGLKMNISNKKNVNTTSSAALAYRAFRQSSGPFLSLGKLSDAHLKRLTRRFQYSRMEDANESYLMTFKTGNPLEILKKIAKQEEFLKFKHVFTKRRIPSLHKIGEGCFGEVFAFKDNDTDVVVKLIPVEGSVKFNGELQKSFAEVLPEVIVSREVAKLNSGYSSRTGNFVQIKRISLIIGKFPTYLTKAWTDFKKLKGSDNDHPKIFPITQQWIVLESDFCGKPLENLMPSCPISRLSIFCQSALALSVAEDQLNFEHRDLHWGNILISDSDRTVCPCASHVLAPTSLLKGIEYQPPPGPFTRIVDFTLSRLDHVSQPLYLDLAQDEELFQGTGDTQFQIYRDMRTALKNNWQTFNPLTNLFWLTYLAEKLQLEPDLVVCESDHAHEVAKSTLLGLRNDLKLEAYTSACQLIFKSDLFNSLIAKHA